MPKKSAPNKFSCFVIHDQYNSSIYLHPVVSDKPIVANAETVEKIVAALGIEYDEDRDNITIIYGEDMCRTLKI